VSVLRDTLAARVGLEEIIARCSGLSPEAIQASGAYATDLARKRTVSLIRLDATGGSR
jgi:hypothetical protein